MKWNDDWRNELKEMEADGKNYCYSRLCECRNNLNDVKLMSRLMYKYNQDKEKSECLDRVIEWVTDWNSQTELYNSIYKEYEEILNFI